MNTIKKSFALLSMLMTCFCFFLLFPLDAKAEEVRLDLTQSQCSKDFSGSFNAATKQARTLEEGDTLVITIPKGKYVAKGQLRIYSNTTVIATNATITNKSGGTLLRLGTLSGDWAEGFPGYTGFTNITFDGGTWDGNAGKALFRFGHSTNITIQNATFQNVKSAHMIEFGGCKDVSILKCTFQNYKGPFATGPNTEALQIDIVGAGHFSAYPPNEDETPTCNFTVDGCTFKNLQRGVGTHSAIANSYFDNIKITNNTFTNITGYAITAFNFSNSKISNNKIKNCGSGIRLLTYEASNLYESKTHSNARKKVYKLNTEITNNTISVSTGYKGTYESLHYGIALIGELATAKSGNAPKGDWRISGVKVSGNKITMETTGYAIRLLGATNITVASNKIYMKGKKVVNTIYSNGIILSKSTKVKITKNTILNTAIDSITQNTSGISLNIGCDGCSISSNTIDGTGFGGIYISGCQKTTVSKNKVTNPGRFGIVLNEKSSGTLSANDVSGAKEFNTYISPDSNVVEK